MKIEKNKSLKNLTTFKIGGKADFFVEAKNNNDILKAVNFAKKQKIPSVLIGNGSNILINDRGFRGLVIKIQNTNCKIQNSLLICEAGVTLAKITQIAMKNGLTGVEFLLGIPGSLGGAIVGNAGTKKKSISDIIESVKILNNKGVIDVPKDYFDFSYRDSKIKKNNDIILEATLKLKKIANREKIKTLYHKFIKLRVNQPKGYSAGSIFKNPPNFKAGELIEKCQLKGLRKGDAEVSRKHANFIINLGKATALDVNYLITKIQKEVLNKFGVQLVREIRYLDQKGWK